MRRFYLALTLLLLMGAHESIAVALGANVVGFNLPPVLVFGLVALSPFLLLVANGMPTLVSLLPAVNPSDAPTTINVQQSAPLEPGVLADAVFAGMSQAAAAAATAPPIPVQLAHTLPEVAPSHAPLAPLA